jgi:type II secretory pathway pseudopilin PulG
MLKPTTSQSVRRPPRAGFTLVEMLVAVGLVLLIMLLLANVFSLAASTATKQKGTAENDQQARTFTTIIQGDICARSFRDVIPFRPIPAGTDINTLLTVEQLARRRGYFSISENNPDSQKDDVLSFTIDFESLNQNCVFTDRSGVRARAVILGTSGTDAYLFNNPNQPEGDDGFPFQNQAGASTSAEVCYFLRDGNLHRRVMLLRDQYDSSPGITKGQPTDNVDNDLVTGDYPGGYSPNGSGIFWRDFDYSALYHLAGTPPRPWFLIGSSDILTVASSLDNGVTAGFTFDFGTGGGPVPVPLALGIPHFRFGHDIQDTNLGRAREFLNTYRYNPSPSPPAAMGEQNFIGRFTTQETAHNTFTYPGNVNNGNPMRPASVTLNDANRNGVVDQYDGLNRRGDDILLTNVIEFDVKVWDDVLNRFVDLGHSARNGAGNPIGQYNLNRNRSYNDVDMDTMLTTNYNGKRYELPNDTLRYGNTFDTWHWFNGLGQPPYRPTTNGPDLAPGAAGVNDDNDGFTDYDGSGNPDPQEQGWIGTDDEVPLKAIEITIRYTDPTSGLVRQVTLLNSLLD